MASKILIPFWLNIRSFESRQLKIAKLRKPGFLTKRFLGMVLGSDLQALANEFLVWVHVNILLCIENVLNLVHLTRTSAAAVSFVTFDTLKHTWAEVNYQLDVCKGANTQYQ